MCVFVESVSTYVGKNFQCVCKKKEKKMGRKKGRVGAQVD